jgi:hypothetical protein
MGFSSSTFGLNFWLLGTSCFVFDLLVRLVVVVTAAAGATLSLW